jgi:hypothetical protein
MKILRTLYHTGYVVLHLSSNCPLADPNAPSLSYRRLAAACRYFSAKTRELPRKTEALGHRGQAGLTSAKPLSRDSPQLGYVRMVKEGDCEDQDERFLHGERDQSCSYPVRWLYTAPTCTPYLRSTAVSNGLRHARPSGYICRV